MSRLFVFGILVGLAGALAVARFYPWVDHERRPAEASVIANGGRAETFVVRLPVDRIARIASNGRGTVRRSPLTMNVPEDIVAGPVGVEQFKIRAADGAVIGVASRHWTETPDGVALAWSLTIPSRGTVMLTAPGGNADVTDAVLGQIGFVPGEAWSGELELAAVGDLGATRTIAASREFTSMDVRFTETWSITGVSEDGELRGTIVLDTIGRRGS